MKALLVYTNVAKVLQIPMGLASISACLKKEGVDVMVWDNTFETVEEYRKKVKAFQPDYICFSALSPDYEFTKTLATMSRSLCTAKHVIGGPHATYLVSEVIHDECFDVVIRGEGETSLCELIKSDTADVPGTWVREGNTIHMNNMGVIPDVNKMPWLDYESFKGHFNKKPSWGTLTGCSSCGTFITSRGCPFKCTYCGCESLSGLYPGQKITRYRDVEDHINEIADTVHKYNLDSVWFTDETFTINKQRTVEFCNKYKEKVNLPFAIETRPNTVNEEIVDALQKANCKLVRMGIESGSDRVRNDLYKRNMSRETIIKAFKMVAASGMQSASFNICGAPTETKEEIRETIALNKECGVTVGKMTIFTIFPGSRLWSYCKEHNYFIREGYPENYYIESNIKHDTLTLEELMDLRKEFVEAIGGFTGSTDRSVV